MIPSNLLTEEQARERWCPFARCEVGEEYLASANRWGGVVNNQRVFHDNPKKCRCIASRCMAWRGKTGGAGYCGLAGVP